MSQSNSSLHLGLRNANEKRKEYSILNGLRTWRKQILPNTNCLRKSNWSIFTVVYSHQCWECHFTCSKSANWQRDVKVWFREFCKSSSNPNPKFICWHFIKFFKSKIILELERHLSVLEWWLLLQTAWVCSLLIFGISKPPVTPDLWNQKSSPDLYGYLRIPLHTLSQTQICTHKKNS